MPANITIVRPVFTNNDTLEATDANAVWISSATVPDATAEAYGVIKLAGDLGGTAAEPVIGANKVTLAKVQKIATDKLLGRSTAEEGNVELIPCTANGRDVLANTTAAGAAMAKAADVSAQRALLMTTPGAALVTATDATGQKGLLEKAGSTVRAVAALDVDCSTGVFFSKTIAGNSTFTFSSPPAAGAYAFTLELTHTSGTITWPASVKWSGDITPTLTAGKTHLCAFITSNGGTRWRGAILPNYVN